MTDVLDLEALEHALAAEVDERVLGDLVREEVDEREVEGPQRRVVLERRGLTRRLGRGDTRSWSTEVEGGGGGRSGRRRGGGRRSRGGGGGRAEREGGLGRAVRGGRRGCCAECGERVRCRGRRGARPGESGEGVGRGDGSERRGFLLRGGSQSERARAAEQVCRLTGAAGAVGAAPPGAPLRLGSPRILQMSERVSESATTATRGAVDAGRTCGLRVEPLTPCGTRPRRPARVWE